MLQADQVRSLAFAAAMVKEAGLVDAVKNLAAKANKALGEPVMMAAAKSATKPKGINHAAQTAVRMRMAKAATSGAEDVMIGAEELDIIKEGKNRLARAIDVAKSGVGSGGNTMNAANRVAGLTNLQERTKPAVQAMAGRFKEVADTIKARPKLRTAALSLLREKRI